MNAGIQLVLPGLFDLPLDELEPGFLDSALPELNRLLRFGNPIDNRAFSLDDSIAGALGLAPIGARLPMARCFRSETDTDARLMLAEAIHLRPDMHNAIAMPIPDEPENQADLATIMADLAELFADDFDLLETGEGAYLLRLRHFDAPQLYPHPLSVLGKNLSPYVEQSRQVLPWYKLLNEIQMFLHQHPLNQRRLQNGRLMINSLWTWGAGEALPRPGQFAWFGDDALCNRFAEDLGAPVASLQAFAEYQGQDPAVVVDLRLLRWLKTGSEQRLDQLLLGIESQLIEPAMTRLLNRLDGIRLRAGYAVDFELGKRARYKIWRRHQNLGSWQQGASLPQVDESAMSAASMPRD